MFFPDNPVSPPIRRIPTRCRGRVAGPRPRSRCSSPSQSNASAPSATARTETRCTEHALHGRGAAHITSCVACHLPSTRGRRRCRGRASVIHSAHDGPWYSGDVAAQPPGEEAGLDSENRPPRAAVVELGMGVELVETLLPGSQKGFTPVRL